MIPAVAADSAIALRVDDLEAGTGGRGSIPNRVHPARTSGESSAPDGGVRFDRYTGRGSAMTAEPSRLSTTRTPRGPASPSHLRADGRRLWRRLVVAYVFEPHHLAILEAACQARDRMTEAREAIERDGLLVEGRFGPRAHPAIAVERDSRLAMMRALRELGLDLEQAPESRPAYRIGGRR